MGAPQRTMRESPKASDSVSSMMIQQGMMSRKIEIAGLTGLRLFQDRQTELPLASGSEVDRLSPHIVHSVSIRITR